VTDKVDVPGFVKAWSLLGLAVSTNHAAGLFNRYGQDVCGGLPVMVSMQLSSWAGKGICRVDKYRKTGV
jgi:hypothetical protein